MMYKSNINISASWIESRKTILLLYCVELIFCCLIHKNNIKCVRAGKYFKTLTICLLTNPLGNIDMTGVIKPGIYLSIRPMIFALEFCIFGVFLSDCTAAPCLR